MHWASSYFVHPSVILKYVNHPQQHNRLGKLSSEVWITSSDNFASWGGGDESYHIKELEELVRAVDYVSTHTYPFHDTHYNRDFWESPVEESNGYSVHDRVLTAMKRSAIYAQGQYESVKTMSMLLRPANPFILEKPVGQALVLAFMAITALLLPTNTSKPYTIRLCVSGRMPGD